MYIPSSPFLYAETTKNPAQVCLRGFCIVHYWELVHRSTP